MTSPICTSPVCCQRAIISREVALVNSIRHRHFRDSRPEVCLLNEKVDSNDQGRSGTRYRMCDSTELKPVDPCSNLGQRILYPRLCSLQKERLAEKSITNQLFTTVPPHANVHRRKSIVMFDHISCVVEDALDKVSRRARQLLFHNVKGS